MALKKFYSMVIGLIIGLVLTGCASQQPILIGFAGELTHGPQGFAIRAARIQPIGFLHAKIPQVASNLWFQGGKLCPYFELKI